MFFGILFVYVILIILSLFKIEKKRSFNVLYLFICIFLIFFSTFRDENACRDYSNYLNSYLLDNEDIEFSFVLISSFAKKIFNSPLFLFFVYAFLGVAVKFYAIKHTKFVLLSVLIYYSNFYILHDLTQIRAGVATAIFLFSIPALVRGDWKKYTIFVIAAAFFHVSAAAYIGLLALKTNTISKFFWVFLILMSYILYFFSIDAFDIFSNISFGQLSDKYNVYVALTELEYRNRNVFNILQIVRMVIVLILILKIDILSNRVSEAIIIVKCYVIGVIALPLLISVPDIAIRVSELFLIVEIIAVPYIIYCFKQNKIAYMIPFLFSILCLYINLFYAPIIGR